MSLLIFGLGPGLFGRFGLVVTWLVISLVMILPVIVVRAGVELVEVGGE